MPLAIVIIVCAIVATLARLVAVPNNLPIPAVRAIANAPQNVTWTVARKMFVPPAFAPIAPRRARKPKDAANTIGTSAPRGRYDNHKQGHRRTYQKRCGRGQFLQFYDIDVDQCVRNNSISV
jgi:hypothetical protein